MFKHRWYVNGWIYSSHYDARTSAQKFLKNNIEIFNENQKMIVNEIVISFNKINKMLYDNWIYFPSFRWIRKDNKIWYLGDHMIDSRIWTQEMRINGAEILDEIKTLEISIFDKLKSL